MGGIVGGITPWLIGALFRRVRLVGWFEVFERAADGTERTGAAQTLKQVSHSFLTSQGYIRDSRTSDAVLELQGMHRPGGCRAVPIAQSVTVNGHALPTSRILATDDTLEVPLAEGRTLRVVYHREQVAEKK